MLDVECLELLDEVVGALARDVGGDLVAGGVQRGARVEQQIGDADLAAEDADHVVAEVLGGDDAQVQHGRTLAPDATVAETIWR